MITPGSPTTRATLPQVAAAATLAIGRLARRLRQESLQGRPLTQMGILSTIRREGRVTLGELAAVEQVAPPTITRAVAALEQEGFLVKEADETDRRVQWARLTPAGEAELDRVRGRREAWLTTRLALLDEDELEQLEQLLPLLQRLAGEDANRSRPGEAQERG